MPKSNKRRWWRMFRTAFRWCRIAALSAVLALVCGVVWLNQIGLPGAVKRALFARILERGVNLSFENMRLDLFGGVIVDRVFVEEAGRAGAVRVAADSIHLLLDMRELMQRRLAVTSLIVHDGSVTIPLSTNTPGTTLIVESIEARAHQTAPDEWQVDQLEGRCVGARLRLNGWVAHATELPKLFARGPVTEPPTTKPPEEPGLWRQQLRRAIATMERIEFVSAPEILCRIRMDAAKPETLRASLNLESAEFASPWGGAEALTISTWIEAPARVEDPLSARLLIVAARPRSARWGSARHVEISSHAWPLDETGAWRGGDIDVSAGGVNLPWGDVVVRDFHTKIEMAPQTRAEEMPTARLDVELGGVRSRWGEIAAVRARGRTLAAVTNVADLSATLNVSADRVRTEWGTATRLSADLAGEHRNDPPTEELAGRWGPFAVVAPYRFNWTVAAEDVKSGEASAPKLEAQGDWLGPLLRVKKLTGSLAGGGGDVAAQFDAGTRAASGSLAGSLDPKLLGGILGPKTTKWLGQFGWEKPPTAVARVGVTLPAWGADAAAWSKSLNETVWLDGVLTNGPGSFRGVTFDYARLTYNYTNEFWTLTNLVMQRPEGTIDIYHESNEVTHDHYWRIVGDGDLKGLAPVIESPAAEKALELFTFSGPTHFEGELWGRWRSMDRYGGRVNLELTNFTLRGESIGAFRGHLQYTNGLVRFDHVRVQQPEGVATIDAGSFDVPKRMLTLANVDSRVDPRALFRMLGPVTARTMEAYRFPNPTQPPHIHATGRINVTDIDDVDLKFHVRGEPFEWETFHLSTVDALLHWTNATLRISDAKAGFYEGKLLGDAWFNFSDETNPSNTLFGFDINVAGVNLNELLVGTTGKSNRTEGTLSGRLIVTRASTADPASWFGSGHADLRDGLLWEAPIFGFLSKPLNLLSPGIGNSRASAATNTFTLTNSVFRTEDLSIYTGPARLAYRGTVDFDTHVNARVEAEILRDSPFFGQLISTVLMPLSKVFEFRVTGTLAEPEPEPVWFLPRLMILPLSPFRTLEDLLDPRPAKPPPKEPAAPDTSP